MDLPFALNSEPVKWTLIVLSAPVWMPFFRALWKEWNDSLRDEGGMLGFAPTARELEQINRREGRHKSILINETWDEYEQSRGLSTPSPRSTATRSAAARPRGFRSR